MESSITDLKIGIDEEWANFISPDYEDISDDDNNEYTTSSNNSTLTHNASNNTD
jgi:hypothetical protein